MTPALILLTAMLLAPLAALHTAALFTTTKPNILFVMAAQKPASDCAASFKRKDTNHDDRLSLEEYLASQKNPGAARKSFAIWNTDEDGFLSRAEFVNLGGQSQR